jgi:hypothetical protein
MKMGVHMHVRIMMTTCANISFDSDAGSSGMPYLLVQFQLVDVDCV